MNEAPEIEYLKLLLDHAFDIVFIHDFGLGHVEHVFVEILRLISESSNAAEYFVVHSKRCLLSPGVDVSSCRVRPEGFIDDELSLFICHATRWPVFLEIAREGRGLHAGHDSNVIHMRLLEALEDDWDDRDFYRAFKN